MRLPAQRLCRSACALAIAAAASACGAAKDSSTAVSTAVVVKALTTPDVHVHYTITLTCGSGARLTAQGIHVPGADAKAACAFLNAHSAIFSTQHTCMTVDGGSAAVTETRQGKTIKSCIGGMMGTGDEGQLLQHFQALIFGRS
jgi:hypothetical protein